MMRTALLSVSLAVLAACDGGGSAAPATPPTPVTPAYELQYFETVGTSADLPGGVSPLNPAIAGGNFTVTTRVADHTQGYRLQLWLSENANLSSADVKVYDNTCTTLRACGSTATFVNDCFINASNEFWCADHSTRTDLTAFLDTIPKDAFLIANTCDWTAFNCTFAALPVQFQ